MAGQRGDGTTGFHDSGVLLDDGLADIMQRVIFWASQRYSMKNG